MTFEPAQCSEKLGQLALVLQDAPVHFSLLFGSAAQGRDFHDLDVAVLFRDGVEEFSHLLALGARLERAARVPVDLVSLNRPAIAFQFEVSKGIPLTVQDPEGFADWRERVWREYFDLQPFLESHAREYLAARARLS